MLDHPELQVAALQQLINWQLASEESGHDRLDGYVERLLTRARNEPVAPVTFDPHRWTATIGRRVQNVLSLVVELSDRDVAAISNVLAEDDDTVEELNGLLRSTLKKRQKSNPRQRLPLRYRSQHPPVYRAPWEALSNAGGLGAVGSHCLSRGEFMRDARPAE